MSDSYVCSGATMRCSMGTSQAKLTVLPSRTVFLTRQPIANISDHQTMVNLAPFGLCRSLAFPATASATAAALGTLTPMPCMHNTPIPWMGGKMDYLVKGQPALLKSSKCQCLWGGTISITNDGQTSTGPADLAKKPTKVFEKDQTKKTSKETSEHPILDKVQLALDVAGFIPLFGAVPDVINAGIYALRGDMLNASLSSLAAVPGAGDVAGAAKLTGKGIKAAKAAKTAKAAKASSNIEKVAKSNKIMQRDPVTKRIINPPSKVKGIKGFNPSTASNLEKGNYGEILSHNNKVNNPLLKEKGYDLERIGNPPPSGLADKGHKGIDGIYKNKTSPPYYVIDEAKYGKSQLARLKDGTRQMSDQWIKGYNRLNASVGRTEARRIKWALRRGEVDRVLTKVDEKGNVTTVRLNKKGKEMGPWP